ncbi:VanZ family protein [Psychrobacillus sp. OK032]|uniref:VanZ family protein n=1 Tax=Psychrobacillus sp. OK032 TaxID=1884358 RepID=UPI0008B294E8|nr:VanZ family protein [Psychrobacillus sp. OK032]SER70657.1 VanZ like family protein [Psychrobacillus sp. OK032]
MIYPLLIILWSTWIIVATTTTNSYTFLYDQVVQFSLETSPNYLDLLITGDIAFTSQFYIMQKIGHMLTFALLYILYFRWWKRVGFALLVTSVFAVFTEILQLYFNRSGRLYDIGIDLLGIMIAYFVSVIVVRRGGRGRRTFLRGE